MDHLTSLAVGELWRPLNYRSLFNPAVHEFHSFPDSVGWIVDDKNDLDNPLEVSPKKNTSNNDINQFLQSWLFFGLLVTVLQLPPNQLSSFNNDFITKSGTLIHTRNLNGYLEEWQSREREKGSESRSLDMIRAQIALDKARRVVTEYCSKEGRRWGKGILDEALGLSLMVLGETLSNAKAKIIDRVGIKISGWHGSPTEGWGTPPCVLDIMEARRWCPRMVHVLRKQLRSHATSILAAFKSHDNEVEQQYIINGHDQCSVKKCVFKSGRMVEGKWKYETKHQSICPMHDPNFEAGSGARIPCKMVDFINVNDLVKTISDGDIPLLRYVNFDGEMKLEVVPYTPYAAYATISHVWADGYGNPDENKLWKCQLDYFQKLLEDVHKETPLQKEVTLFWIDTLAIPTNNLSRIQRANGVRQIHSVFTNAKFTIVIDKGLSQMKPAEAYENMAMRILGSGWMRRLWTLQEAFLSRKIYFAFKGSITNLDVLEDMYPEANDALTSNIPEAARNYFNNLLGKDRMARIYALSGGSGVDTLTGVWRATRWRETNHQEHETLALATLLNIDYQDSALDLQDAGFLGKTKPTPRQLQGMMADLWKRIETTCPGSIPPGIIFLPGTKLSIPGFGWAPETWMSDIEALYPDPFDGMPESRAAKLDPKLGLLVQYPGFLLHAESRRSILKAGREAFHFPSDSTFLEWYSVDHEEKENNPAKGIEQSNNRLAIILCRPKPKERPETALLVEIEGEIVQKSFTHHRRTKIYQVSINRSVRIWRETKPDIIASWHNLVAPSQDINHAMICGEALDVDQQWYVDVRPPIKAKAQQSPPPPQPPRPQPPSVSLPPIEQTLAQSSLMKNSGESSKPVITTQRPVPLMANPIGTHLPPPLPPRNNSTFASRATGQGTNPSNMPRNSIFASRTTMQGTSPSTPPNSTDGRDGKAA